MRYWSVLISLELTRLSIGTSKPKNDKRFNDQKKYVLVAGTPSRLKIPLYNEKATYGSPFTVESRDKSEILKLPA